MLAVGVRASHTQHSKYLRSHLRSILSRIGHQSCACEQLHRPCQELRTFHAAKHLNVNAQQDDTTQSRSSAPARFANTRHLYPHGKVIKRRGRAQRETIESLGIDSLGKRSDVVILRDIGSSEPVVTGSSPASATVTVINDGQPRLDTDSGNEPDERDVNQSIEALRPSRVSLDDAQFDGLVRQLTQGYNKAQLKAFIDASMPQSFSNDTDGDASHILRRSIWVRGSTDTGHRLPLRVRRAARTGLTKMAEQILHSVWGVSKLSEIQEIGEMEFCLTSNVYKFMAHQYGTSDRWQTLFPSPALARTVELSFIEKAHAIRFTGRRYDVLEAAYALSDGLKLVTTIHLHFQSAAALDYLSSGGIDLLQQETGTFIEHHAQDLTVTGASQNACYAAKRTLTRMLSQVQDPPTSAFPILNVFSTHSRKIQRILVTDSQHDLGQGHRQTVLTTKDQTEFASLSSNAQNIESAIQDVARHADEGRERLASRSSLHTDASHYGQWRAEIGYLINHTQTERSEPARTSSSSELPEQTSFGSELPAFRSVLQHFTPIHRGHFNRAVNNSQRLIFEFRRSPFSEAESEAPVPAALPPLEISFRISHQVHRAGTFWRLRYEKACWRLPAWQIGVRMPDREADLQLNRTQSSPIDIDHRIEGCSDKNTLAELIRAVEASQVGSSTQAFEQLLPQQDVRVPAAAVTRIESAGSTMHSHQLFVCTALVFCERHEFEPHHGASRTISPLLKSWPSDLRLVVDHKSSTLRLRPVTRVAITSTEQGLTDRNTAAGSANSFTLDSALDGNSTSEFQITTQTSSKESIPSSSSRWKDTMSRTMRGAVALVDLSTSLARRAGVRAITKD